MARCDGRMIMQLSYIDLMVLSREVERIINTYREPTLAPGYIRDKPDGGLEVGSRAILDGCGWPLRHVADIDANGNILWEGCGI